MRHGHENAAKAGPAIPLVRREVRSPKIGTSIGREECGERPSALATDGRNCGLVAGVDVRALVTVYLDGNKVLVDERGGICILVAFPVHDMAPMAPDGADVEQDRLVLLDCLRKGLRTPWPPLHGLVHGGAEIR